MENLTENYLAISGKVHAVVKANAYGHGVLPVVKTLLDSGCDSFCVADLNEAYFLRRGVKGDYRIIVLGFVPPSLAKNCIENKIIPTVFSYSHARALNDDIRKNKTLSVFVALDTGMNRKGIKCGKSFYTARDELKEIFLLPKIKVDGVYTHYHASDASKKSTAETNRQRLAFYGTIDGIVSSETDISLSTRESAENNGFKPESVRAGLSLYGYPDKKPVMKLISTVVDVKFVRKGEYVGYGFSMVNSDTKIAVVPIGYADGVCFEYSGSYVRVFHAGKSYLCKIFGRICMDFTFVDVRSLPVVPGDKVVFFGETPSDLASVAKNRLPVHSLLTAVSSRVERIYK